MNTFNETRANDTRASDTRLNPIQARDMQPGHLPPPAQQGQRRVESAREMQQMQQTGVLAKVDAQGRVVDTGLAKPAGRARHADGSLATGFGRGRPVIAQANPG